MELKAYAKINLSLDILGRRSDGYHNISSLMQDIGLYDIIKIEKCSESGTKYNPAHCMLSGVDVYLCTNVKTIPMSKDNLAFKGAAAILKAMSDAKIAHGIDSLCVNIDKRLPIAAGIAVGSGNAAATMLGINAEAGYPFSLRELMDIGAGVGADVPYSLMMNAKKNEDTLAALAGISEASQAAWMSGIGDVVRPVEPIHRYVIMANPGIAVSTRAAYEAIDALRDYINEEGLFTNQMEKYTLENYPEAKALKTKMEEKLSADIVLMSGSGPTMVAYYEDGDRARNDYDRMLEEGWLKEPCRAWFTETGCVE